MSNPPRRVTLRPDTAQNLLIVGGGVDSDRSARLFLRASLGARPIPSGWLVPQRGLGTSELILRVHDWLRSRGFEVIAEGIADNTISRELDRRRSFERTRVAAEDLKAGESTFDFTKVDNSLRTLGWSDNRKLRPHQKAGVAHALTAINAANFSVPGSGKTITAFAVAATHLGANTVNLVVIVGPLASFDPWEQEVEAAVGRRITVQRIRGSAARRRGYYTRIQQNQLLLMSYATATADQALLLDLFSRFKVMLVIDESHRVKRFRGGTWAPALLELSKRAQVRMILSGTPMPQSGRDLYSQLNILWPGEILTGTRDSFAVKVDSNFGSVLRNIQPFIARTPKEALGLPPYHIYKHETELSGTQAEIYDLIHSRFQRQLQDASTWREKLETLRRGRPIRLLQAASNPITLNAKDSYFNLPRLVDGLPSLMERLASYSDTPAKTQLALRLIRQIAGKGGKVVCWSNFIPNLDHLRTTVRSELGIPCFQIDGRVPADLNALRGDAEELSERPGAEDTRESIIRRFLNFPGPAVLVTNPASSSESISLHSACHNAIYLDRTYDCALFLQSIDRIHRLGLAPEAKIEIHVLLARHNDQPSIDHLVDASLARKDSQMRQLLEGAELSPIKLADDPAVDAEGDDEDLGAFLRYLLGKDS